MFILNGIWFNTFFYTQRHRIVFSNLCLRCTEPHLKFILESLIEPLVQVAWAKVNSVGFLLCRSTRQSNGLPGVQLNMWSLR